MNPKKIDAVISMGGAIIAAAEILMTLAGRLLSLAGVPREQIDEALSSARQRAADASAKLDAALDE